jgi:signal transduction histidine kinase
VTVERSDADEALETLLENRLRAALHEIRQPVSAVLALAEAARSAPGVGADVRAILERIIEQAQEVAGAAASVLSPSAPHRQWPAVRVDVDEVVDSVVAGTQVTWTGTITRRGRGGSVRIAGGSRAELRRCLVDVVDNAVRAAGPNGSVSVEVQRDGDGLRDGLRIVVEDDGPGFGRGPRGDGLGLALTRQTLAGMGAALAVGRPSSRGGTRVTLTLPGVAARPVVADSVRIG